LLTECTSDHVTKCRKIFPLPKVLALGMLKHREVSSGVLCHRGQVVTACEKCRLLNAEYSFVTLVWCQGLH